MVQSCNTHHSTKAPEQKEIITLSNVWRLFWRSGLLMTNVFFARAKQCVFEINTQHHCGDGKRWIEE
eukprot:10149-Eustigmatos_ZCMA.PRE.1